MTTLSTVHATVREYSTAPGSKGIAETVGPDLAKDTAFPRLNGHRDAWLVAICRGLRHRGWLVTTSEGERVTGVLPLVLVRGPIFGRFLVSLPYVNTGGVWAESSAAAHAIVDRACELADELDVRFLELRHELPVTHPKLHFERTDKKHLRLRLPDSDEDFDKSLKSKLRSQIRKSGEYGLEVHFGGPELLRSFYDVFAVNMRDLGTPVFSRALFAEILQAFADDAELCVVRLGGRPVAAALLVHAGGVTEVPSASSLREFNRTNANMLMYRHLLRRAIERNSHTFDFGRSTEGSGTYRFKTQWGAEPHPAVWQYYVRKGSPEEMRPDSEGKRSLVRCWQRLPVRLTRVLGPPIVRGIP